MRLSIDYSVLPKSLCTSLKTFVPVFMNLLLFYILLLVFEKFLKPSGLFTLNVNSNVWDGFIGPNWTRISILCIQLHKRTHYQTHSNNKLYFEAQSALPLVRKLPSSIWISYIDLLPFSAEVKVRRYITSLRRSETVLHFYVYLQSLLKFSGVA
jgi:hypothetical protein